ncbi:hypothetical protein E2C01_080439 [Portunus trituberculatus]|uniref:Uncharacterized protein n=1 Tax=Portunus trituberculatus TaxID=210409 RepID=A0A5B7IW50_PORTR|nr:hypothetical protein [Portunus trituberculatus]
MKNSQIRYPLMSSERAQRRGAVELDKASQEAEKEGDEEEPVHGLDIKILERMSRGYQKSSGKPEGTHAVPVTPANPATAGPSASAANGSTAGPSSISFFFKPVKHADPTTAVPSTSAASNIADDDVLSSSAHSADE